MYKTLLLIMCMGIVVFGLFTTGGVANYVGPTPTHAPVEETIISIDELHATQTARPTVVISPVPYPEPIEIEPAYPPPEEPHYMTMEEFRNLIISVFGKISHGKNIQHK